MTTLIRVLIALAAALTVCVAGWAGLHALGVAPPTVAPAPADLTLPAAPPPTPTRPGLAPFGQVVEASVGRATTRGHGDIELELRGTAPATPLVVRLVSDWSKAPLAQRELDAATLASGRIRFAGVPSGALWAVVLPADATSPSSYLARVPVTAPATTAAVVDLTTTVLRVRVRRELTPVRGALVRLERSDDPAWVQPLPTIGDNAPLTGADGTIALGPLGPGGYRAQVVGEAPTTAATFELPATPELELSLPARR